MKKYTTEQCVEWFAKLLEERKEHYISEKDWCINNDVPLSTFSRVKTTLLRRTDCAEYLVKYGLTVSDIQSLQYPKGGNAIKTRVLALKNNDTVGTTYSKEPTALAEQQAQVEPKVQKAYPNTVEYTVEIKFNGVTMHLTNDIDLNVLSHLLCTVCRC